MMSKKNLMTSQKIIKKMMAVHAIRAAIVKRSHLWFFSFYFGHYMIYETAPFQLEMFRLTEDETAKMVVIVAFRGSAKSTIMTTSYPLWAILGKQQKKFVVILGQTQQKAQQYLLNIKRELESNELLKKDLGPFQEERNQWGAQALVIPKFNAKIATGSVEQSIRGIRHGPHRPDLIIVDDIEDLTSVKTREGREAAYTWLTGDIIPAGDRNTKFIVVGNLLHEDCVVRHLQRNIEDGKTTGISKEFPLLDETGKSLWPGKFPTEAEVEQERNKVMDERAWQREYLLRIIPEEDQVVHPDWIHYYDELPSKNNDEYQYTYTGVDLAISDKDTADYTAMVSAQVHGYEDNMKIYILPNPVNERLDFPQTRERIKDLSKTLGGGTASPIFIEDVGYQAALIQELEREGYPAEGVKLHGQDKRARLVITTHLIKNGQILFPRQGAELLIQQLTGFGVERHNDLVDAFTILIRKVIDNNYARPGIEVIFSEPRRYRGLSDWNDYGNW